MPRSKNNIKRPPVNKEALMRALAEVKNGSSINAAAKALGVCKSTLQRHFKKNTSERLEKVARLKRKRPSPYPERVLEALHVAVERREITIAGASRLFKISSSMLYKRFRKQRFTEKSSLDQPETFIDGAKNSSSWVYSSDPSSNFLPKREGEAPCKRTKNLFPENVNLTKAAPDRSTLQQGVIDVEVEKEIKEEKHDPTHHAEHVKKSDEENEHDNVGGQNYHSEFEIKDEPDADLFTESPLMTQTDMSGGEFGHVCVKLDKAKKDFENLQTQLSNLEGLLKAKICSLDIDKAALKSQLSAKESDLTNAYALLETLAAKIDQLTEDRTLLTSELSRMSSLDLLKSQEENVALTMENIALRSELTVTKHIFAQSEIASFANDNAKVQFYTGLPSYAFLVAFFDMVSSFVPHSPHSDFPKLTGFVVTMMRLHLGLREQDLGYRFKYPASSIRKICEKWIVSMSNSLRELIDWSQCESFSMLPVCFKKVFDGKPAVIVYCIEVSMGTSPFLLTPKEALSVSTEKNLVKFTIGIAPNGKICFVSNVEVTDSSNPLIPSSRGLFDQLAPGDVILADREFPIEKDSGMYQTTLGIHAYTKGEPQFTYDGIGNKKDIENVRQYVELEIDKVRREFRLLGGMLPVSYLSHIPEPSENRSLLEHLVCISCALYNVCPLATDMHDHDYSVCS